MTGRVLFLALVGVLVLAGGRLQGAYMLTEHHGGSWSDAEKSPNNSDDDNMCWAAAASNVLEWTGWGAVAGMTTTDEMFAHYQDHWTDDGGFSEWAWKWWFDGIPVGARVDVPGGGGFHPGENFSSYFHQTTNTGKTLATIDEYLRAGYGTTIAVHTSELGHVITVWGFEYNDDYDPDDMMSAQYSGIWITDSDDSKTLGSPRDLLQYIELYYHPIVGWYLVDYFGRSDWRIMSVQGLEQAPEPATLCVMTVGLIAMLSRRRRGAGRSHAPL